MLDARHNFDFDNVPLPQQRDDMPRTSDRSLIVDRSSFVPWSFLGPD